MDAETSFAIVTPTYWRDLARCELLAESLDRCAPDIPHYLIVDRRDRQLFAHLIGGRRRIIESEALLDSCFWQVPGKSGWWLSYATLPVRGWVMQQIKKIAAIKAVPERTLVFCDSDSAFFRRFRRDDLLVKGKIGLLDVPFANDDVRKWTAMSRSILGLPQSDGEYHNYVGYLVCWNRDTVEALQQRVEQVAQLPWQIALARRFALSEYTLYGIFVRESLGYRATDHAPSDVPLIKSLVGLNLKESQLDAFFSNFDSKTIGVMVHSKGGIEPRQFRSRLEQLWGTL